MNTKKVSVGKTQMIAHRGCSCLEKENTMAAFIAAGNRSYYGIETDVHLTNDGEFIIIHDKNTGRVGADLIDVEHSSYNTLRKVTLRDIDGSLGRTDLRLPSLPEYVNTCRRYGKVGILEIKNHFTAEEMDRVMEIIGDYAERMIIISFHYDSLTNLRVHYPDQKAQYLCEEITDEMLDTLVRDRFDIDIYYANMTEELLAKCKARGIATNVWTVDDPGECERFAAMGVDFITSNCCEAE